MLRFSVTIAIAFMLCGCSRQKIIDADELRSDLTAAISLASETQTFVRYVGEKRATFNFAEGHLAYLVQTARQAAQELDQSTPVHSIVRQFDEARKQLDALAAQAGTLRAELAARHAAPASTRDLSRIQDRLMQIKSSL